MEIVELIFDEIDECDIYQDNVNPCKLIVKKDVSKYNLKEIVSCDEYSELQNVFGMTLKVFNQPNSHQKGWESVGPLTSQQMIDHEIEEFNKKLFNIEESSHELRRLDAIICSLGEAYQTAYSVQNLLQRSLVNVINQYKEVDDPEDRDILTKYSADFLKTSQEIQRLYDSVHSNVEKIIELGDTAIDKIDRMNDIKMNFTKK